MNSKGTTCVVKTIFKIKFASNKNIQPLCIDYRQGAICFINLENKINTRHVKVL